ncbi:hypothetical protein CNR33_00065 [Pseudomonas phage tabernarius]|uniref:Uncharacterized protein n=1 Tax=Pseudomonas phage tabernarius TaxID=2048978 RepID=A0A2H4P6X2_9CAUD|nr:hypothetical protein FDJ17_gp65 [Pseudomonas phage tabernarius]ATW57911.1 hypothetical protein CNR33_00065 [Pseudomonas phage tabernarius]
MAKKDENAQATEETKQIALVATGGALAEFMGDDMFEGVTGFEGADIESFAIPFIMVLQKMSPLVDEDDAKYVKGAKAGMLYNNVTGKLYDGKEGIFIIPCAFKRTFIRWGGREGGDGGFKGEMTVEQFNELREDPTQVKEVERGFYAPSEDGSVNVKKNDYFADTRSHFVLIVDPATGEFGQAILSCSSSQIKASRKLMTTLSQKKVNTPKGPMTPPTFANVVKLTTAAMSNDSGTWSGVSFELAGMVGIKTWFDAAKEFNKAVVGGELNADYSKADSASTSGGAQGDDAAKGEAEEF